MFLLKHDGQAAYMEINPYPTTWVKSVTCHHVVDWDFLEDDMEVKSSHNCSQFKPEHVIL